MKTGLEGGAERVCPGLGDRGTSSFFNKFFD